MPRYIDPRPQYLDDAGNPLVAGKVFIFESGSSTPKDLFSDVNLSITAANPVILSGSGRMPNTFFIGSARAKLTDADEVQFWDIDPIGGGTDGAFSDWNAQGSYDKNAYVIASDGFNYQSLSSNNFGNDPTTSPEFWTRQDFIQTYNVNQTYELSELVIFSGTVYESQVGTNINNQPDTSPTQWTAIGTLPLPTHTETFDGTITAYAIDVSDGSNLLFTPSGSGDITFTGWLSPGTGYTRITIDNDPGGHTITFGGVDLWETDAKEIGTEVRTLIVYSDDTGTTVIGALSPARTTP